MTVAQNNNNQKGKEMIQQRLTLSLGSMVFLCLSGAATHAAIVKSLNDHSIIEVSISQNDLTRIAVKDDRILNVFGTSGEYVLESDEEQGQIFIRPTAPISKPLHLTLTTEKGHTQDLRLLPKNQAPETLLLEKEEEDIKPGKIRAIKVKGTISMGSLLKEPLPLMRGEVEELLTACQQERIPLGYKQVPLELSSLHSPYLLIRELRGTQLRGLTYEIKNTTKSRRILSEPEFIKICGLSADEIVAILMPKKILNPLERGQIYVVQKTD